MRCLLLFSVLICSISSLGNAHSPYAPNSVSGNVGNFHYDAAGNRLQNRAAESVQVISYGLRGKPVKINTTDEGTETLFYGVRGRRYKRVNAEHETILYVGEMEYRITDDGAQRIHYISKGGYSPIAQVNTTDLHYTYYLQDHQGTTLVSVGEQEMHSERYDPWGISVKATGVQAKRSEVDDDNPGFTGHETLKSAGLIHANGRILDPKTGFVSADPDLQAGDIRALNRYSYVRHNPLGATDPSGLTLVLDFNLSRGHWQQASDEVTHRAAMTIVNAINQADLDSKRAILTAIEDNNQMVRLAARNLRPYTYVYTYQDLLQVVTHLNINKFENTTPNHIGLLNHELITRHSIPESATISTVVTLLGSQDINLHSTTVRRYEIGVPSPDLVRDLNPDSILFHPVAAAANSAQGTATGHHPSMRTDTPSPTVGLLGEPPISRTPSPVTLMREDILSPATSPGTLMREDILSPATSPHTSPGGHLHLPDL